MRPATITGTVMIVDDEVENLNVLGNMLQADGWDVMAFPDGKMALRAAREEVPDVVLLDINMPRLDGYEVCRRLKALDTTGPVPVIFLSAFSDTDAKVRAFGAGGADYVTKPFSEVEVLARVRLQVRLRRHQLQLEELVRQRVAELAEAHRRLRIWDDAKTQWLETLSHEMRTPLQGLFGIAELLFDELPASEDSDRLFEGFARSRARIMKLVDDAVMLTTVDVGADRFVSTPTPLKPILEAAVGAASHGAPDVQVTASLNGVDGVRVPGTVSLLERAFTDLVVTATRCARTGETVAVGAQQDGPSVRVVIATDGRALPPEALETFFVVGGQRTLLKGGGDFGLGPALASRVLRLFNGAVSVLNGPERGIEIEARLPVEPADASLPAAAWLDAERRR